MMKIKEEPEKMVAVITGATSGIGYATARKMVEKGAIVIGTGRTRERCDIAQNKILKDFPGAVVSYIPADLSSLGQVKALAAQIRNAADEMGKACIDVLVNNAGTFSNWYVSTEDGFELQFAVNHLASFLLTCELLPLLKMSKAGKVIMVSSGSHYGARMHWNDIMMRKHYRCLAMYKQTKLANVLFAAEFNRREGNQTRLHAYAVDPGLVNTDIGSKRTTGLAKWIWDRRRKKGISPEVPANCITFLCENMDLRHSPHIYWKNCMPQKPSAYSQNEDAARRLWEISEKMCGIKYNY